MATAKEEYPAVLRVILEISQQETRVEVISDNPLTDPLTYMLSLNLSMMSTGAKNMNIRMVYIEQTTTVKTRRDGYLNRSDTVNFC